MNKSINQNTRKFRKHNKKHIPNPLLKNRFKKTNEKENFIYSVENIEKLDYQNNPYRQSNFQKASKNLRNKLDINENQYDNLCLYDFFNEKDEIEIDIKEIFPETVTVTDSKDKSNKYNNVIDYDNPNQNDDEILNILYINYSKNKENQKKILYSHYDHKQIMDYIENKENNKDLRINNQGKENKENQYSLKNFRKDMNIEVLNMILISPFIKNDTYIEYINLSKVKIISQIIMRLNWNPSISIIQSQKIEIILKINSISSSSNDIYHSFFEFLKSNSEFFMTSKSLFNKINKNFTNRREEKDMKSNKFNIFNKENEQYNYKNHEEYESEYKFSILFSSIKKVYFSEKMIKNQKKPEKSEKPEEKEENLYILLVLNHPPDYKSNILHTGNLYEDLSLFLFRKFAHEEDNLIHNEFVILLYLPSFQSISSLVDMFSQLGIEVLFKNFNFIQNQNDFHCSDYLAEERKDLLISKHTDFIRIYSIEVGLELLSSNAYLYYSQLLNQVLLSHIKQNISSELKEIFQYFQVIISKKILNYHQAIYYLVNIKECPLYLLYINGEINFKDYSSSIYYLLSSRFLYKFLCIKDFHDCLIEIFRIKQEKIENFNENPSFFRKIVTPTLTYYLLFKYQKCDDVFEKEMFQLKNSFIEKSYIEMCFMKDDLKEEVSYLSNLILEFIKFTLSIESQSKDYSFLGKYKIQFSYSLLDSQEIYVNSYVFCHRLDKERISKEVQLRIKKIQEGNSVKDDFLYSVNVYELLIEEYLMTNRYIDYINGDDFVFEKNDENNYDLYDDIVNNSECVSSDNNLKENEESQVVNYNQYMKSKNSTIILNSNNKSQQTSLVYGKITFEINKKKFIFDGNVVLKNTSHHLNSKSTFPIYYSLSIKEHNHIKPLFLNEIVLKLLESKGVSFTSIKNLIDEYRNILFQNNNENENLIKFELVLKRLFFQSFPYIIYNIDYNKLTNDNIFFTFSTKSQSELYSSIKISNKYDLFSYLIIKNLKTKLKYSFKHERKILLLNAMSIPILYDKFNILQQNQAFVCFDYGFRFCFLNKGIVFKNNAYLEEEMKIFSFIDYSMKEYNEILHYYGDLKNILLLSKSAFSHENVNDFNLLDRKNSKVTETLEKPREGKEINENKSNFVEFISSQKAISFFGLIYDDEIINEYEKKKAKQINSNIKPNPSTLPNEKDNNLLVNTNISDYSIIDYSCERSKYFQRVIWIYKNYILSAIDKYSIDSYKYIEIMKKYSSLMSITSDSYIRNVFSEELVFELNNRPHYLKKGKGNMKHNYYLSNSIIAKAYDYIDQIGNDGGLTDEIENDYVKIRKRIIPEGDIFLNNSLYKFYFLYKSDVDQYLFESLYEYILIYSHFRQCSHQYMTTSSLILYNTHVFQSNISFQVEIIHFIIKLMNKNKSFISLFHEIKKKVPSSKSKHKLFKACSLYMLSVNFNERFFHMTSSQIDDIISLSQKKLSEENVFYMKKYIEEKYENDLNRRETYDFYVLGLMFPWILYEEYMIKLFKNEYEIS